jgi:hypothetical protein
MQNVEGYAGSVGTEPHASETGLMDTTAYVELDVHKATVSVAVAESGRGNEIRQIGVFENRPEVLAKLAARLTKVGRPLSFCYEAGRWCRHIAPSDMLRRHDPRLLCKAFILSNLPGRKPLLGAGGSGTSIAELCR